MKQFSDEEAQAFMRAAGDQLFDLLTTPLPEELSGRVVFPKCPHCKRRPELIKRRAKQFQIQIRPYSKDTLTVDGYELLPCCSAMYAQGRQTTDISKVQKRSLIEQFDKKVNQTAMHQHKQKVDGVTAGTI
jgi:hypothetical protein